MRATLHVRSLVILLLASVGAFTARAATTAPAARPAAEAGSLAAQRPTMKEFDGRSLPEDQRWPKAESVVRFRPAVADNNGPLVVENYLVHDVTNQKGIAVRVMAREIATRKPVAFATITLRNCTLAKIARDDAGQRLDVRAQGIHIIGGGEDQPVETDLLLEDVTVTDSGVVPILIDEGKFKSITFRRVKTTGTVPGIQITTINAGFVREIVIDDCPGLKLDLLGRPDSIQRCIVRNSPKAVITDTPNFNGKSGVQIVDEGRIATTGGAGPATRSATVVIPATTPAQAKPRLVATGDIRAGKVKATILGGLPESTAFVTFEAFDKDDYRVIQPITVTDAPWEAQLDIQTAGRIRVQAVPHSATGDAQPAIVTQVDVVAPRK